MTLVGRIGAAWIDRGARVVRIGAIVAAVLYLAVQPRYWPRTVRERTAKQILFTGYEALSLILFMAILTGVSVVAQTQLWLNRFGQSAMLGGLLVAIIVNEAAPLLVNVVVIARSGTAIATELASMNVQREVEWLDAQGVDPSVYLLMPRVLGVALSVLGLTMLFVLASFVSGYLFGLAAGLSPGVPGRFILTVFQSVTPATAVNLLLKTLLPGLITGAICCAEGMSAGAAVTEIPQAATRAVVRSLAAVLIVSALVSVMTYV